MQLIYYHPTNSCIPKMLLFICLKQKQNKTHIQLVDEGYHWTCARLLLMPCLSVTLCTTCSVVVGKFKRTYMDLYIFYVFSFNGLQFFNLCIDVHNYISYRITGCWMSYSKSVEILISYMYLGATFKQPIVIYHQVCGYYVVHKMEMLLYFGHLLVQILHWNWNVCL